MTPLPHWETGRSAGLSQHLWWLPQELDGLQEGIRWSGQESLNQLQGFAGTLPCALDLFLVPGGC